MTREQERAKHRWLWEQHVAARKDLSPTFKLALNVVGLHCGAKSDACTASYRSIAKGANLAKRTVIRAIAEGERLGLLWIERTPGGHHDETNRFHLLIPRTSDTVESPVRVTKKAATGVQPRTGRVTELSHPNLLREPGGGSKEPPHQRERETVALARDDLAPGPGAGGLDGRAPDDSRKEDPDAIREAEAKGIANEYTLSGFAELRALYDRRDHLKDDLPEAIAEQLRAYRAALRIATHAEIMEGTAPHVAAADAPRFLVPLVSFLRAQGWTKPPPEKRKANCRRGSNNKSRRMTPARAMADLANELRRGA